MPKSQSDPAQSASRRLFLAGAAALAALPAGVRAQDVTANATPPAPDQDAASLAAKTDAASHLTVAVTINGKPYNFVIDTGAEKSVIADDVVTALGLPLGPAVMVDGIARRIEAPTVTVDALGYGPFSLQKLDMPILPRISLIADGYLGLDAISNSRVTFDFKHHTLTIEPPKQAFVPDQDAADSARIKARGAAGHLRVVDCVVDGVEATAFIDSGAEVSIGNPALYNALKARNPALQERPGMVLSGATGGELIGQAIPVSRIRLQHLAFTDGTLVIADVPDFGNWGLRDQPSLLIGMDYLRQFSRVAIDYRAKEIRFELALAPPNPTPGVEIGVNA